jgi:hypothetical protein
MEIKMARNKNRNQVVEEAPDTAVQAESDIQDTVTLNETNVQAVEPGTQKDAPTNVRKSIVPSKYAGKYKRGGSDELATFINSQSAGEDGKFSFDKFFELAVKNGLDATKVEGYRTQVNEKRHGAQGRARMTIRNMLATPARKNGKLVGLDGQEHNIQVAAPVVPGRTTGETGGTATVPPGADPAVA